MRTTLEIPETVNAKAILWPYMVGLVGAVVMLHIWIAFRGGMIGVVEQLLLALIAIGMVVWLLRKRHEIVKLRFGPLLVNALSFVVISTSFQLHALIQTFRIGFNEGGLEIAKFLLGTPWFGLTLCMSALWGLGVLIHFAGAIMARGWED